MGEASNVATLLCTLGPSVIYTDYVDYLPPLAVSWAASEPWMGVDRDEAGSRNAWVAWKSLEKLGAATRWRAANCRRTSPALASPQVSKLSRTARRTWSVALPDTSACSVS